MASPIPSSDRALLLSLLFSCLHFSIGSLLRGSVTCIDCSPSYDLSGVRLAVNCPKEKIQSYALTDAKGQFQTPISNPSPLPSDCSVNLLGGKSQLCGFKKSITSKIIAINSSNNSSDSSYLLQTPLAFFTSSCETMIERAKKLQRKNGDNNGGGVALGEEDSPEMGGSQQEPPSPAESFGLPPLPPLIYLFPFFPIIGIP